MYLLYVILSLYWISLYGDVEDHFRTCIDKPIYQKQQIDGIDYIYMINLDKRPERLQESLLQLQPYGVIPYRFSAVDGRSLLPKTLSDLCVTYQKNMQAHHWAHVVESNGKLDYVFLQEDTPQLPILSEWMTLGAVGCALSHLSILQDAYEAGYNTIWVFEDDITVKENPHLITELIMKLDDLTQGQWDLLYTDPTGLDIPSMEIGHLWWMWRPEQILYDTKVFFRRSELTKDFIQVGSHTRTHSIIIRRSGMEKILNHIKDHHLYLPFDHEIAFTPDINLYVTSTVLVTYNDSVSDIKPEASSVNFGQSDWEVYKKQQLAKLNEFSGWCDLEKANHIMNFVHENCPQLCVEIGTLGGSTTFPLASTFKYIKQGQLFTIDAWDNDEAIAGLRADDPNCEWWGEVDLKQVYKRFLFQMTKLQLKERCKILAMPSQDAVNQFADESIDMLYIDGNFSAAGSLADVTTYFPKVKPGGYIWLNDASYPEKLLSVTYLMRHAIWQKENSIENKCIVFQKNKN